MATTNLTLPFGETININVGKIATDCVIYIDYSCLRTFSCEVGKVTIISKYTDNVEVSPLNIKNYDDCGIQFTADYSGENIRLNCIVDNSSGTDVEFNYNIKKLVHKIY